MTPDQPICPECSSRAGYRLADGRRQCRKCRRKFTPHPAFSRLPRHILQQGASSFWMMLPASTAARALKIDRKTVRRLYARMQEGIAREERGRFRRPPWTGDQVDFCVRISGGLSHASLVAAPPAEKTSPPPEPGLTWFFSETYRLPGRPGLTGQIHYQLDAEELSLPGLVQSRRMQEFPTYLRRTVDWFHRHNRRTFALYPEELIFRFNHRRNPAVITLLAKFLRTR